jgi:hypothetical protein
MRTRLLDLVPSDSGVERRHGEIRPRTVIRFLTRMTRVETLDRIVVVEPIT